MTEHNEIRGVRTNIVASSLRAGDTIVIGALPVARTIEFGDTITFSANPDYRSWWQRMMPRWLGGKQAPQPFEGVVTTVSGSTMTLADGSTITTTFPL